MSLTYDDEYPSWPVLQQNTPVLPDSVEERDQRFARDIRGKVVGPMPPDLFLEKFLPCRTRVPRFNDVTFSNVPDEPHEESEIYTPLKDDLNKVLDTTRSPLAIYYPSNRTGSSKPDLGMFRRDDRNKGHLKDTRKRAKDGNPKNHIYTACMGDVYTFIEVRTSDDLDPLADPPDDDAISEYGAAVGVGEEAPSNEEGWHKSLALGRSAKYAHTILTRQFRTCVYSISIAGTTARLLRWDRSGLIVTESFNYKEDPLYLTSFVWRFSKSTDEQRGYDLSAKFIDSESERSQFTAAIKRNVQEQIPGLDDENAQEAADRHYWPGTITHLTIGDGAGAHTFWVSRPIFTSKGPAGRSTTGYWGVDCKSGEVVFVKDIWRTDVPGVETEGIVLGELLRAGVRNVPELVCHGDVTHGGAIQFTRTDQFADEEWVVSSHPTDKRHGPIRRVHYRLVTKGAGFRLSDFTGSRELLSATYDVLIAVMDAHSKANTLHRDLSLGNIILLRVAGKQIRVGYLIDWELSCKADKVVVRDHVLIGTPAFMSIAASETATPHAHRLKDDLESLFYVVLYSALLWLPVASSSKLYWWLTDFFGVRKPGKGGGHDFKLLSAIARTYTEDLTSTRSQAVVDWLTAAMDLHYHKAGGSKPAGPNPEWDDGKALKAMWEGILARELPNDDRCKNPVLRMRMQEDFSLHAAYTTQTTSTSPFGSHVPAIPPPPATSPSRASFKRPVSKLLGGDDAAGPSNQINKRRRLRRKGKHDVEDDSASLSGVFITPEDSPDVSPTRGGKLQRTDSQVIMPPPPPGPSLRSSRSTSTKGKNTRRSTKQTGGSSATGPVSESTATTARNGRKR